MTDKEINQKLQKMEKQLDAITTSLSSSDPRFPSAYGRADEIDLRELFNILWQGKWWIVGATLLFSVVGVFYAKRLPNMYKSAGIYAPAQSQGGSGLGGQLGGLASLAGVNLGVGDSNDIDQAMALLTSWPFLEKVIDKHNLKPLIMGVKAWDRETDELIWDDEIYDSGNKKWLSGTGKGKQAEPSSYEVYKAFKKMIEVGHDVKAGMVNVSVQYFSPVVAKAWVDILVVEVNSHFQTRDMLKAKKSIEYLENKIGETSISEMQAVFYGMIESQTKTLMLAEVDERYLLVDVVQPQIAEVRSSPKRVLIAFLFTFLGGILAVVSVLARGMFKNSKVG